MLFLFLLQLMQIMIKVSDVSNEARPMEVAEPWLDCLLQEFFIQVRLIILVSFESSRNASTHWREALRDDTNKTSVILLVGFKYRGLTVDYRKSN